MKSQLFMYLMVVAAVKAFIMIPDEVRFTNGSGFST